LQCAAVAPFTWPLSNQARPSPITQCMYRLHRPYRRACKTQNAKRIIPRSFILSFAIHSATNNVDAKRPPTSPSRGSVGSDKGSGDWEWSDDDLNVSPDRSQDSWSGLPNHQNIGSFQNSTNSRNHSQTGLHAVPVRHASTPVRPAPRGMKLHHSPSPSNSSPLAKPTTSGSSTLGGNTSSQPSSSPPPPPLRKAADTGSPPNTKSTSDDDLFLELGLSARPTFHHHHHPPTYSSPALGAGLTPSTAVSTATTTRQTPAFASLGVANTDPEPSAGRDDSDFQFDDWNEDDDELDALLDD
jgi:hypothetical protein